MERTLSTYKCTKPATDLCFVCQVFLTKLNTSGRMSEEDKEGAAKQYSDHLELARKQRLLYKTQVLDTKATCASQDIVIGVRWKNNLDYTFMYFVTMKILLQFI